MPEVLGTVSKCAAPVAIEVQNSRLLTTAPDKFVTPSNHCNVLISASACWLVKGLCWVLWTYAACGAPDSAGPVPNRAGATHVLFAKITTGHSDSQHTCTTSTAAPGAVFCWIYR